MLTRSASRSGTTSIRTSARWLIHGRPSSFISRSYGHRRKLLVLDEPTLGLDLLYRKQFYDALLNEYFDGSRTILITTHQVEEIQDVLTDLIFIQHGRIVLDTSMDAIEARYTELMVRPEHADAARALKPLRERQIFCICLMFSHLPESTSNSARSARPASPSSSSPPWKNHNSVARR